MSDRRPTPSAAGDDDPTPPHGALAATALDADEWDDDEEWDEPNYLIRRALVVAAVVAAIAGVAVLASTLLTGGDEGTTTDDAAAQWNTIVVLTADEVQLVDRDAGDEIETYPASDDLLDAQSLVAGSVLVTMTDEGRIVQTDLTDGTQRRGRSGLDQTLRISADHPAIATSGPDEGGDVTIIDTRDRSVLSVADVAGLDNPLIFSDQVLVNPAGTHVAVPVPNAFQSVVIDLTTATSQALAGRVIALDDERIVTEQPAGARSELEFYDVAGERLGSVDVPGPQATLLRDDGSLLMVDRDGTVRSADADGSVDEIGTLADPDSTVSITVSGGIRVGNGTRLLALGARQVFVVDPDGEQLGVAAGTVSALTPRSATCAVVGTGTSTAGSTVLDLDTGAVITQIERGIVTAGSADGCTAAIIGAGPQLLTDGEVVDVDADSIAAVAPDGSAYVVIDGRDSEFIRLGDEDAVDIADQRAVIHFGQL